MKTVIICEKPSVAQTVAKALGVYGRGDGFIENDNYIITWCVGHLVTMAYPEKYDEKYSKWDLNDLPFLPKEYKYEVIKDVRKQFETVKGIYHRADIAAIYYCPDPAREGIYIQELVRMMAGHKAGIKEMVIWLDSFTDSEVKRGIREAKPITEYSDLIASAYERAVEDYAVGINFSRALSCKFGYKRDGKYHSINVGRVMTTVLGMVVRRELEIRNFKETLFYKIDADCGAFKAGWKAIEGTRFFNSLELYDNVGFLDKSKAENLLSEFNGDKYLSVEDVSTKKESKKAPTLFNLAELQAECSKEFKLSPDETLQIAQVLYEAKLTTYPRTDARVLTTVMFGEVHKVFDGLISLGVHADEVNYIKGTDYKKVGDSKRYVDDSKVTDHYAITPTGEGDLSGLTDIQRKVYEKIVLRFLAIFYPEAVYQKTEAKLKHSNGEFFFASKKILVSKGYLEIYGKEDDDTDASGSISVSKGDRISAEFGISEGKTTPPKRYTSGSMILAMENAGNLIEDEELRAQIKGSGIGTSATRAETIKKLVTIGYLNLDKKTQVISPTQDGFTVYEIVDSTIPMLLSPEMTAAWERGLSQVAEGQTTAGEYRGKLETYISDNIAHLKSVVNTRSDGNNEKKVIGKCPVCGGDVVTTSFGYGCSNYKKDDPNSCGFAIGQVAGKKLSEKDVITLITKGKTGTIKGFKSKAGKIFDAPLRLNAEGKVEFDFAPTAPKEASNLICPKCGKSLEKGKWSYSCECGFMITHTIAGKELTEDQIRTLMDTGRLDKTDGFTSKAGKKFSAALTWDGNGIKFDFGN